MTHLDHEDRPQPQRTRSSPQLRRFPVQFAQRNAKEEVFDDCESVQWENDSEDECEYRQKWETHTEYLVRMSRLHWKRASPYDRVAYGPLEEDFTYQSAVVDLRRSSSLSNLADSAPLPPTDSYLCAICRGVFYYCKDPETAAITHRVVDVFNGASKGCKFCQMLNLGVVLRQSGHRLRYLRAVMEPSNSEYGTRCKIEVRSDWGSGEVRWEIPDAKGYWNSFVEFNMEVNSPDSRVAAEVSTKSRMPTEQSRTSSKLSLDLARFWLTNCAIFHPLCRDSTFHTGRLPTRLLKIFDKGLLLCRGSELLQSTLYVTLSHRWGANNKNRLSKALFQNQPTFWSGDELLPTFRDTVSVAERLGVSYLWIDSLCIIQDSEEDRARECSRMGEVYGNAYCNVAATASIDGTQGLFRVHEVGGPSRCQVSPRWTRIEGENVFKEVVNKAISRGFHFWNRNERKDCIDASPLGERAWVIQERLLAPRILHFAERQIYWECREEDASEQYPSDHPLPSAMENTAFSKQSRDLCKLVHEQQVELYYETWAEYVELYSRCNLTRPDDKLVALGGIARRASESLQACGRLDSYLAGLWRNRLLSELLWNTGYRSASRYTGHYRAPSWSWASIDGEVNMDYYHYRGEMEAVYATIVGAYTTTSIDPFGAVTAGAVDVLVPLLRTPIPLGTQDVPIKLTLTHLAVNISLDFNLDSGPYDYETVRGFDMHALLLMDDRGLLLRPVAPESTHAPGTFTRIGYFNLTNKHRYDSKDLRDVHWKAMIQAIRDHQDPDLVYKESGEDGTCLITII